MRRYGIVLTALLGTALPVFAQATPPAPAAPPAAALDKYLLGWEAAMRKVTTLKAELTRVDKDKAFGTTTKFVGWAEYMKVGTGATALNLASMELRRERKVEYDEKFICSGTFLYQFLPAQKEIRAYALPKPKPGEAADDSFLSFLFGMKAEAAKKRYVLAGREDKLWVYIDITPRLAEDKGDFTRARLVLHKDTYLPRQLWFAHAKGDEVTWDIPKIDTAAKLDRRNFDKPTAPPGWKLVEVKPSAAPPPRVARPSPGK